MYEVLVHPLVCFGLSCLPSGWKKPPKKGEKEKELHPFHQSIHPTSHHGFSLPPNIPSGAEMQSTCSSTYSFFNTNNPGQSSHLFIHLPSPTYPPNLQYTLDPSHLNLQKNKYRAPLPAPPITIITNSYKLEFQFSQMQSTIYPNPISSRSVHNPPTKVRGRFGPAVPRTHPWFGCQSGHFGMLLGWLAYDRRGLGLGICMWVRRYSTVAGIV